MKTNAEWGEILKGARISTSAVKFLTDMKGFCWPNMINNCYDIILIILYLF